MTAREPGIGSTDHAAGLSTTPPGPPAPPAPPRVRTPGVLSRWSLWSLPRAALAYVLAVDAVAVVLGVLLAGAEPVHTGDWRMVGLLVFGCAVHIEAARGIERRREVVADGQPYIELKSMWSFAALLLLPLGPALGVVAFTFAYWWLRVSQRPVPHRWIFSCATVVIASCAAWTVLGSSGEVVALVSGPLGLLLVVAAALVRWLVNHGLVVGVISLAAPSTPWRQRLGSPTDTLIGLGALALGVAMAVLAALAPWFIPLLLVPVMGMHRGFLLQQFARAARTDAKTGLANAPHWRDQAQKELERVRRRGGGLAVLMVDLDAFKAINDRHGHLAGDAVLRSVADALRAEVRAYDAVGRFGGEEFVVLLAGVSRAEAAVAAERVRVCVSACAVPIGGPGGADAVRGLTASVGVATFPDGADGAGTDLDGLMHAADVALFAAKRAGRNRVEFAAPS